MEQLLFVGCLTSQQHASVSQGRYGVEIWVVLDNEYTRGGRGGGILPMAIKPFLDVPPH